MRADLHRYAGLSLGDMYEGRVTPDEVWDCVTHFPRDSATWSAAYADPEFPVSDEPGEMPLSEYSPEVELLTDCYDMLAALLAQVQSFGSKKAVKLRPHRRPGEARRKAAEERRRAQARREWNELLGKLGVPVPE